jgi:hypothetical protein
MTPDDVGAHDGFTIFVVDEDCTVYRNRKAGFYILYRPTSEVCVQLTPEVVIDVSVFSFVEFVDWDQFVTVVFEHLMNLKILRSESFDEAENPHN